MVKIERKRRVIGKTRARDKKKMCQRSRRTKRKSAQKEMKKRGQRIQQEQKRKSVGRTSLINFLKKKVLPMTVKRQENGSRKERISNKKRRAKEDKWKGSQRKEIGRHSNGRRMKEARGMKSPRVWEKLSSWREGTCLKRKEDWNVGTLKPQRSRECYRRKEEFGRIPIKGQETRRRRRKALQKGWRIEKKEREG